jgi:uncharacterized protein YndB with AHSA1/START domain
MNHSTPTITVKTKVNAPLDKVWNFWTTPQHICLWNFASPEWHNPFAENNLQVGGKFLYRMEAKDGSFGFDFWGIYTEVVSHKIIGYEMGDGRKATITFSEIPEGVLITETFEAETINPIELQEAGWLSILNNFKKYVEEN